MSEKADASTTTTEKPATAGSKLMVGLMGLNSLLLAGVLAVSLLRPAGGAAARPAAGGEHGDASADASQPKSEGAAAEDSHGAGAANGSGSATMPGPMLPLPDFVVHLRDPDSDRYARLTLSLELRAEADKEVLNAYLPQIRDAFLAYLSDRTVEELRGSEGMGLVKQDLTRKLHELVPSAPVKALYVTDIVVQ